MIGFSQKRTNAANLTFLQYEQWCKNLKGSLSGSESRPKGFFVNPCITPTNRFNIPFTTDHLNPGVYIAPKFCLCDTNGNGKADPGETVKDIHGNILASNIKPFLDLQNPSLSADPLVLASLNQGSQNLFTGTEFNTWVAITLNDSGNLEMVVDLRDVPTLDQNPTFANEGFTEMNLVYRDAMGSFSGIDLGSLNQGEKNFLEFDPAQFDPFGDFSAWQLGVTVYNPTTMQHALQFEDEKIPEPTSTLSLLALGTLGAAGLLRRKRKA